MEYAGNDARYWRHCRQCAVGHFYSLEKLSEHPLAEAVVNHLKESAPIDIQYFESITGKGVKGRAQGRTYLAGNRKLLEENHIAIPPPCRKRQPD